MTNDFFNSPTPNTLIIKVLKIQKSHFFMMDFKRFFI